MAAVDKSSMDACKIDKHDWFGPLACNGTVQGVTEPECPTTALHKNACVRVVICVVEYISSIWSAKEDIGIEEKVRSLVGRGRRCS